ncbi:MAG: glucokinase [Oligoflexus sp.]|nr:glucokinase [Oligoflexus sp.]
MNHFLVADIGGTNARIGLVTGEGNEIYGIEQFSNRDFPSLKDVIANFLAKVQCAVLPKRACFAVASPVLGDRICFTNNSWSFSIEGLKGELGLDYLHVMNDFEAVARSLPFLGPGELKKIGGGAVAPHKALAVLGPGTGLGMAALLPALPKAMPLPSEGGHAAFYPGTAAEEIVFRFLREQNGFVSNEDVLSGMGLCNIYSALALAAGRVHESMQLQLQAADISERALNGGDSICREALSCFCGVLGAVAGDYALQVGAQGGVFIAGGIVSRFVSFLEQSTFRQRFEAKGRMSSYVTVIPTYVIMGTQPGLIGAASIFDVGI